MVIPFIYFHTLCVRTAKALGRLRGCAGSPEPSLVANVISTIILWAGSCIYSLTMGLHFAFQNLLTSGNTHCINFYLPVSPTLWFCKSSHSVRQSLVQGLQFLSSFYCLQTDFHSDSNWDTSSEKHVLCHMRTTKAHISLWSHQGL